MYWYVQYQRRVSEKLGEWYKQKGKVGMTVLDVEVGVVGDW